MARFRHADRIWASPYGNPTFLKATFRLETVGGPTGGNPCNLLKLFQIVSFFSVLLKAALLLRVIKTEAGELQLLRILAGSCRVSVRPGDALFHQYRPGRCSEDKRCSGRPFAGEEQKYPSACWIRMLPPRRKAPGAGGSSCSSLKRPCRSVFRCRFTDRNHLLLEMLDRAPRNEITCERRIKLSQERIRLLKRLAPSSANAISIPAIPATWTM